MTENVRCPACYRKYSKHKEISCPQCGLSHEDANLLIADPKSFASKVIATGSSTSDLEWKIRIVQDSVAKLAWALVLFIISSSVGFSLLVLGTRETIKCAFLPEGSCSASSMVDAGWALLGFGALAGLLLAIRATGRGGRN
jgi:hypothetical protein